MLRYQLYEKFSFKCQYILYNVIWYSFWLNFVNLNIEILKFFFKEVKEVKKCVYFDLVLGFKRNGQRYMG